MKMSVQGINELKKGHTGNYIKSYSITLGFDD